MRYLKYLILALIVILPVNVFSGIFTEIPAPLVSRDTDTILPGAYEQLNAYYDLRDRKTYIQVSYDNIANVPGNATIHVQIFQHDTDCEELNFEDELTTNDTVVYDMDNLVRNDGTPLPFDLQDDSYGYVVVTAFIPGTPVDQRDTSRTLLGNFRIIDDAGYEYRTNMVNTGLAALRGPFNPVISAYIANFNNVDGANQADVVGFVYTEFLTTALPLVDGTVFNFPRGFDFDVFVFDLNEEPISCGRRNFACGNVMNYGIADDFGPSRGNDQLCNNTSLPDSNGGFISFENATFTSQTPPEAPPVPPLGVFTGYIGINNGDGTGSMDSWLIRGIPPA